ncbi:hypothetical protein [Biostraticola tofi]|uniref:hypothetical protein n=1 Tax=Biostraticola tofi TaxID=466109 RepID=UPI001042B2D7|nr:hypothetical protein [Biostraticola tofi]
MPDSADQARGDTGFAVAPVPAELLNYWITGLQDYWIIGLLDYWITGLLDYWITGLLDYWISRKQPLRAAQRQRQFLFAPLLAAKMGSALSHHTRRFYQLNAKS